jgi:hypothetical protein
MPCFPTTATLLAAVRVDIRSLPGYGVQAIPLSINQTGIRAFCAEEDAVVRVDPAGICSTDEAGILTFNPLNQ